MVNIVPEAFEVPILLSQDKHFRLSYGITGKPKKIGDPKIIPNYMEDFNINIRINAKLFVHTLNVNWFCNAKKVMLLQRSFLVHYDVWVTQILTVSLWISDPILCDSVKIVYVIFM